MLLNLAATNPLPRDRYKLERWLRNLLLIAALVFASTLLFAPKAQAEPAIYKGTITKCSQDYPANSNYLAAFLDVGKGSCWQCPKSNPKRTIFAVDSGKACEKPAHEVFKRASGPKNPSGVFKTDCPSGYFLDIGKGKCYSCGGYARTGYTVTGSKACSRRIGVKSSRALEVGDAGCADGSFRNGLTNSCYSCPAGTYRNANIANDLTKINACTRCGIEGGRPCPVTTLRKSCDKFLAEDIVKNRCVKTQAGYVHEAALKQLEYYGKGLLGKAQDALSLSRDRSVVNALRNGNADTMARKSKTATNPCVFDAFNTWSLGGTAETGLIIGGALETGMAVDVSPAGRSGNQRNAFWYGDASFSLGLQAGSSAGINYGCWTAANNNILGAYHGITMSLSDVVSGPAGALDDLKESKTLFDLRTASPGVDLMIGVWFSYDENIKEDAVLDVFPIKKGVGQFLGITLTPVFGQGTGFGPSYVRAYTGQFPGKQPEPTANAASSVDRNIIGMYNLVGTDLRNEFRMIDENRMEARRAGSSHAWSKYIRVDDYEFAAATHEFVAAPQAATYTIRDDGSLLWRSNDSRNLSVELRPVK